MRKPLIITGTDTEIGKTYCSVKLIQMLVQEGLRVASMKPVATGCYMTPAGLRNDDALQLQSACNVTIPYEWLNPYAFEPPIAPHIAASIVCQNIELTHILHCYEHIKKLADVVIIEGVGGWRVPFNQHDSLKNIAKHLDANIILVVGLRLGCINHALLTAECIQQDGISLAGWIANQIDNQYSAQTTINTLRNTIAAPLLASIPYQQPHEPVEKIMFSEQLLNCIEST
ncbi:dethiobiotin synthase [Beggiatoa alba B18LD]|uniref:ATP-dependent dethiobiotin synthetase BioD n=1 Tax=Beggiatoa alba B18LD TaxID=395493 RepID=I3CIF5_9GAMM|nr:dethiobiotin synthase [Beggiatoa alba]EIJ43398.1 dethiobiotin synthase [Beggiatoa alba B18LD]